MLSRTAARHGELNLARIPLVAVLTLGLTLIARPAAASHDVTPARVEGSDRVSTAAAVAGLAYPQGAETAVLARADDWPDALAGAPLAGLVDGPVLLTPSAELPPATRQALEDLGVDSVILLGGTQAISPEIEDGLGEQYDVLRIAGVDRYGTAAAVAREVAQRADQIGATPGGMRSAFIASGETFADALAAGAPAALGGAPEDVGEHPFPVLLTGTDELPGVTAAALGDLPIEQALIVGGEAAVSSEVAQALEDLGLNVVRLEGPTRTATAAAVADFTVDILPATSTVVHLARGDSFPDALTAGPLAASLDGPLLLTQDSEALGDPVEAWLRERCPGIDVVRAVGGTAAIATGVLESAEQAAQSCHPTPAPIAYLSRTGNPLELRITTPGGEEVVVAGDAEPTGGYDWSPDGSQIVYTRFLEGQQGATELVVAAIDGSSRRVLTSDGFDDRFPRFSPDGQTVMFTRGPTLDPGSGLYAIDVGGTGLRELIDEPDAEPLFPQWSPDGARIVYERFPDGGEPQIAIIDADGTNQQVIAEQGVQPAWSPDGELIAFVSSHLSGQPSTLQVVQPDGGGLRHVATDVADNQPAWSPTGQLIAFAKQAGSPNEADLAVVARDGTAERVIVDVRPFDGSPTWSPDSGTIGFVAAHVEGASDIYLVDVDGSNLHAVTGTGAAYAPRLEPA